MRYMSGHRTGTCTKFYQFRLTEVKTLLRAGTSRPRKGQDRDWPCWHQDQSRVFTAVLVNGYFKKELHSCWNFQPGSCHHVLAELEKFLEGSFFIWVNFCRVVLKAPTRSNGDHAKLGKSGNDANVQAKAMCSFRFCCSARWVSFMPFQCLHFLLIT